MVDSKRDERGGVDSYEISAERGRRFFDNRSLCSDNESSDNDGMEIGWEGEASLYGRGFFLNWFVDEQLFVNEDEEEEEVVDDKSLIGDDDVPAVFDFECRPIYTTIDRLINQ